MRVKPRKLKIIQKILFAQYFLALGLYDPEIKQFSLARILDFFNDENQICPKNRKKIIFFVIFLQFKPIQAKKTSMIPFIFVFILIQH